MSRTILPDCPVSRRLFKSHVTIVNPSVAFTAKDDASAPVKPVAVTESLVLLVSTLAVLASPAVAKWHAGLAIAIALFLLSAASPGLGAPQSVAPPTPGQPGKDVVWVPTSPELVEKMLDMGEVTSNDFVIDLGSGDGRNVIAAAKRGARALGVEYNPDLVELSRQRAAADHVSDKATFVQGDMYAADVSQATVLALFLTPEVLDRMTDKFLAMKPGARIVLNTFPITDWEPDATETIVTLQGLVHRDPGHRAGACRGDVAVGRCADDPASGLSVRQGYARRPAGDWTPPRRAHHAEICEHRIFRGGVCRSNHRHGNCGRTSNDIDCRSFATPVTLASRAQLSGPSLRTYSHP